MKFQLDIAFNSDGSVGSAYVRHDGLITHIWPTPHDDRVTVNALLTWANRVTACDAAMTMRNVIFSP